MTTTAMADAVVFCAGDKVEVCSKEEGFKGSYYAATVIRRLSDVVGNTKSYQVEYKNLVEEEDHSVALREFVRADEVRPLPPRSKQPLRLHLMGAVDVFDNDGWWVGKIAGKKSDKYVVYFESSNQSLPYHQSQMRNHLDWVDGKWVYPSRGQGSFARVITI